MHKLTLLIGIFLTGLLLSGCQQLMEYKAKAGLQVITDDVPSSVFLNGQYFNSTPMVAKDLKPGEYAIRIEPNNPELVPYETTIQLKKGLLTVVTWKPGEKPELSGGVIYEMEPLPDKSKSEIYFTTVPDGAIISLEGKEKDFSPVVFADIPPGNRSFEVTLPSYEAQNHTINVQSGYRMLVKIKLAKLQAVEEIPSITTSPDATLSAEPTATESTVLASPSATLQP